MGTDQELLIVALKLVLISGEIRKGPDVSHFDGVSIYTLVGVRPIKQVSKMLLIFLSGILLRTGFQLPLE
jgi:hypothetical protein